jgi:hypothetical protein
VTDELWVIKVGEEEFLLTPCLRLHDDVVEQLVFNYDPHTGVRRYRWLALVEKPAVGIHMRGLLRYRNGDEVEG